MRAAKRPALVIADVINITMKKVPLKYIVVAIFFGSILFNFAASFIFPFDEFIQASIRILIIIILFSFITNTAIKYTNQLSFML